jgi:hypothetical protein
MQPPHVAAASLKNSLSTGFMGSFVSEMGPIEAGEGKQAVLS